jgi:hypothetical protein
MWDVIDQNYIPINRWCIKNKWIFKVERNGIFRGSIVACGFSQVHGISFNENFAPVLNDVSFRIMLIAKLVWDMTCIVIDIETAFIHGDLDEEIYMEVPKGLTISENKKLLLRKTIYGIVKSPRKFYKKLIINLKFTGFYRSKSNNCLWTMWDKITNHMLIIVINVNDCLVIGKEETIASLIDELKNHVVYLKIERNVYEYLIFCIEESRNKGKFNMIQPHLLTHLTQNFGDAIK